MFLAGPLSPSLTIPQPPVELTPQEVTELGYMPLRDDFERVRQTAFTPYYFYFAVLLPALV